jgi:hypothetical protein
VAFETANLLKRKIVQDIGGALAAQANLQPKVALQLIQGIALDSGRSR